jgi:Patatin-like phospholipase
VLVFQRRYNFRAMHFRGDIFMARFLPVFLRHGLMLLPLWILAFAAISGWIGTTFGFHNLFRDHPGEFPDLLPNAFTMDAMRLAATTSAFQIAVYATAFLGLSWSVAVLSYEYEQSPENAHPVKRARSVLWPVVVVLALLPIAAGQMAIANAMQDPIFSHADKLRYHGVGLALSFAGALFGLVLVTAAVKLAMYAAAQLNISQFAAGEIISGLLIAFFSWPAWLMPGFAFFLVLSVFVLIYALTTELSHAYRFAAVGLIIVWAIICGGIATKHKFADLAPYYASTAKRPVLGGGPVCLSNANRLAAAPNLTPPLEYLDAWRRTALEHSSQQKPVFVVVASSGGGYRASYWNALVLDKLLTANGGGRRFKDSIGLMTGASGGMISSAYLAALAANGAFEGDKVPSLVNALDLDIIDGGKSENGTLRRTFRNANRDSLTPIVQELLQHDIPLSLIPLGLENDRGTVLQDQWKAIRGVKFLNLLPGGGATAFSPAIIFSPMLVASGRPLLVSNLDLSCVATKDTEAVELFRVFPHAEAEVSLATAARMSASFPYVTPATELPTEPPQRVVDAGYYDNDGIGTAAAFLLTKDVKEWLEKHASRVVILRINAFSRASPDTCSVRPAVPEPLSALAQIGNALSERFGRSLHWLSSPIEGAWVARETKARFSNRQTIDALTAAYPPNFLNEIEFAFDGAAAESWHLPQHELNDMEVALGALTTNGKPDEPASCANAKAADAMSNLLARD